MNPTDDDIILLEEIAKDALTKLRMQLRKNKNVKVEESRIKCRAFVRENKLGPQFEAFVEHAWKAGLVYQYRNSRNSKHIDWRSLVLDNVELFPSFGIDLYSMHTLISDDVKIWSHLSSISSRTRHRRQWEDPQLLIKPVAHRPAIALHTSTSIHGPSVDVGGAHSAFEPVVRSV